MQDAEYDEQINKVVVFLIYLLSKRECLSKKTYLCIIDIFILLAAAGWDRLMPSSGASFFARKDLTYAKIMLQSRNPREGSAFLFWERKLSDPCF
jgi:hypothetical protein